MSISTWEFGDEVLVERVTQSRYLLFDSKDEEVDTLKKKLLLINCSYDKLLVPYADDYGIGTKPITDRQKLRDLVHIINAAPVPPLYTVWDLFMDYPTKYDSALIAELKKMKRVTLSSHPTEKSIIQKPHEGLDYALAQYATMSDTFLKYRLMYDNSVKYLPLRLYEALHPSSHKKFAGFVFSEGWWLNSFIVDLPIRRFHMDNNEITVWNVGEALDNFTPEEIQETVKGRLLVVGDFYENDIHQTFLGEQPGPLLMINTYLGIVKGRPKITLLLFSLVFMLYFATTWYVLSRRNNERVLKVVMFRQKIGRFFLKYLTYIVVFTLFTVFVYVVTGQHLQLLLFALYFNVIDFVENKYGDRINRALKIG
ncbi:MAG: hypothetical protein HOP37_10875 [Cyclobacteriaceae bacterium]|nr:hypothetical protein [Cyclobacteriaceae bacterium]